MIAALLFVVVFVLIMRNFKFWEIVALAAAVFLFSNIGSMVGFAALAASSIGLTWLAVIGSVVVGLVIRSARRPIRAR